MDQKLLDKIDAAIEANNKKPIKTWSRRSMITPDFVGHNFAVHNGKTFVAVYVTENMVGHKLGNSLLRVSSKLTEVSVRSNS